MSGRVHQPEPASRASRAHKPPQESDSLSRPAPRAEVIVSHAPEIHSQLEFFFLRRLVSVGGHHESQRSPNQQLDAP